MTRACSGRRRTDEEPKVKRTCFCRDQAIGRDRDDRGIAADIDRAVRGGGDIAARIALDGEELDLADAELDK